MKPWALIGSTAGRSGAPGDPHLPNGGWRQESTRRPRAASGLIDASRRSCRAAQSGPVFPATAFPMPASVPPPIPVAVPRRSARALASVLTVVHDHSR